MSLHFPIQYKLLRTRYILFLLDRLHLAACERLKSCLAPATTLVFPSPDAQLLLMVDASTSAIGAVLNQGEGDSHLPFSQKPCNLPTHVLKNDDDCYTWEVIKNLTIDAIIRCEEFTNKKRLEVLQRLEA